MIPIVSFVGKSNSGKTTLLAQVIRALKSKGYRVGVIKHSPHGFEIDQPGKDSWRFAQAGADAVAISSPDKVAFIERVDGDFPLDHIRVLFEGKTDILLTEGYKDRDAPKILVLDTERDDSLLRGEGKILATVVARLSSLKIPQFDDDDVARIADLLVARINTEQHQPEIPMTLKEYAKDNSGVASYHR